MCCKFSCADFKYILGSTEPARDRHRNIEVKAGIGRFADNASPVTGSAPLMARRARIYFKILRSPSQRSARAQPSRSMFRRNDASPPCLLPRQSEKTGLQLYDPGL